MLICDIGTAYIINIYACSVKLYTQSIGINYYEISDDPRRDEISVVLIAVTSDATEDVSCVPQTWIRDQSEADVPTFTLVTDSGLSDARYVFCDVRGDGAWYYRDFISSWGVRYFIIISSYWLCVQFDTAGVYGSDVSSAYIADKHI